MAKGISLHIGINRVDPIKYELEWYQNCVVHIDEGDPNEKADPENFKRVDNPDNCWIQVGYLGTLNGCERDAEDMLDLASELGFETTILKTEKATAKRVKKEILAASEALDPGDFFLLTYAGHGAHVDDLTGDEEDAQDETWCLYDRMLIDDERHALMAKFKEGVRVVVLADCCHSGTTMRSARTESARDAARGAKKRVRSIPRQAADAIYKGRKEEYDEIQKKLPSPPEEVKAKVILISACQDDELADDGEENGAFTGALKKVWSEGAFEDYRKLHARIKENLEEKLEAEKKEAKREGKDPDELTGQTPNFQPDLDEADKDPEMAEFVSQKPLSI